MIFADEKNLYIRNGLMPKIIEAIGLEGAGLYLVIRSFEFENPNGVDEMKVFQSSSDEISESKRILEDLIEKGYAERTNEGIKTTDKQF